MTTIIISQLPPPPNGTGSGSSKGTDLFPATDTTDLSSGATGTTKKYTLAEIFQYMLEAQGLTTYSACRVATTANLTATYSNGTLGVGATLTNATTQAALTVDGVSVAAGDRVLVWQQSTTYQNGIYVVTNIGTSSANWILTRATDFDQAADVIQYAVVLVNQGTLYEGVLFQEIGDGPFTIGTTPIIFDLYNANALLTDAVLLNPSVPTQTITTGNLELSSGNFVAGQNGTNGYFVSYPSGINSGLLNIRAEDNVGDYIVSIRNASFNQESTLTIPDPGSATSTFAMNTGVITSGHLVSYNGTTGLLQDAGIPATGAITTINGNSGSATPTAGAVTINGGTTGLTTSGSSSTLSLTGTLILANGGTNNSLTASAGGIVWSDATKLNILSGTSTAGQLLLSGSSATPSWTTSTYPSTNAVNTLLYASSANVMAALATANSACLVTNGSGVPAWQTLTAGQILIGTTAGAPAAAAINSGTGILVDNSSGSITINATGGGLATVSISGTTQAAAVSTRYIALNAAQTTVTLPSTYAVGDVVELVGSTANTGGWILTAAAGDTICVNNSITSAGGTVTCTAVAGQCISVVCDVADTSWIMTSTASVLLTTA